jgi:hypothetical protein
VLRWHHLFGLVFGIITFTWIFSGLMSMNPWKIFDSNAPKLNVKAYQAGELDAPHYPLAIQKALATFQSTGFYPRELEWQLLDGKGYYIGFDNNGQSNILAAEDNASPFKTIFMATGKRGNTPDGRVQTQCVYYSNGLRYLLLSTHRAHHDGTY